MPDSLHVSTILPASPQRIYEAWLDSEGHAAMTGFPATVDPAVGGRFSAGDGYIQGTNLELEPHHRILQAWRTTDFPEGSPDSRLEVLIEAIQGGTRVTLVHTGIPEGQGYGYEQGWRDYYFEPMQRYFSG